MFCMVVTTSPTTARKSIFDAFYDFVVNIANRGFANNTDALHIQLLCHPSGVRIRDLTDEYFISNSQKVYGHEGSCFFARKEHTLAGSVRIFHVLPNNYSRI